jgi:hypothetical protein
MTRLVTFLSLASHHVAVTTRPSAPAASAVTSLHPQVLLLIALLVVIACVTVVVRIVNFVVVNLVAQFVQVAAAVFRRTLAMIVVLAIVTALLVRHI